MPLLNYVNLASSYGPTLNRQNLNISGIVNLRRGLQLSVNSSIVTRQPVIADIGTNTLPGVDLANNPLTPVYQPLPGLAYSCLNEGCGQSQLAAAVAAYNSAYAGTLNRQRRYLSDSRSASELQLGAPVISQDFRLTKAFTIRERYKFSIVAEVFNAFNISNVTIGSYTLDTLAAPGEPQTYSFGQPTGRVAQTFGQGGPRAFQIAGRISF